MSLSRQACWKAFRQHENSIASQTSIRDALVHGATTHGQRRYGSNVPGPLEARRRLARRRNTSLAMTGSAGTGIDPVILFGMKMPDQRQQLQTPMPIFTGPEMPLAYVPCLNAASDPHVPTQLDFTPPWLDSNIAEFTDSPDQMIIEGLKGTKSIEDIRNLVTELGISLHSEPRYSRLLFKGVLDAYRSGSSWTIQDIGDFLFDPSLNTLGSKNFVAVVRSLVVSPGTYADVRTVFAMINEMLSLGAVPRSEISSILNMVKKIKTTDHELGLPHLHGACYYQIWQGLDSCSVMRPSDLGRKTLTRWLYLLSTARPSGNAILVTETLIRLLASPRTTSHSSLQNGLIQIVRLKAFRTPEKLRNSYWCNFHKSAQDVDNIRSLFPYQVQLKSILQVTERLAFSRRYRTHRQKLLQAWCGILAEIDFDPFLRSSGWDVSPPKFHCQSHRIPKTSRSIRFTRNERTFLEKRWLLRIWLVKTLLSKASKDHRSQKNQQRLLKKLLGYKRGHRSSRGQASLTSYIHERMKVLGRIGFILPTVTLATNTRLAYERALKRYQTLPEDVFQTLARLDVGEDASPFHRIGIYSAMKCKALPQLNKLVRGIDVTAPDFVNKMLLYTETKSPHRSDLLRILRRHTSFKIALAFSWKRPYFKRIPRNKVKLLQNAENHCHFERSRNIKKGRIPAKDPSRFPPITKRIPSLNPKTCLNTMHSIALIFACSTQLTPRTSYRLTRWCYEFLVHHHAPIKPTITRALYHAGIQRFREAGLSVDKSRISYILDLIREVEGPQVASIFASGLPAE